MKAREKKQKSILILGPAGSGKTKKAKAIASKFKEDEVVFIPWLRGTTAEDYFLFSDCSRKTKLVVFDEIREISGIKKIIDSATGSVEVNKKLKHSFEITPMLVLVFSSEIRLDQLTQLWGEECHKVFDVIHY